MPTILVVDDSLTDRRLAGGLLEKTGQWGVIYAEDGKDALLRLELDVPDLVLTDMQMPNMNGLELVETIKREYPLIPTILMTAQGSEEIAVQALQRGAASYVPKKRLADDLVETVERVLAASHDERSSSQLMNRMALNEYEFVLENDLGLVMSVANYLQQGVRSMRLCGDTDRLRVGIALEEALLNAYYHGNLEVSSELREVDHKAFYELARQRALEAPYWDRRIRVRAKFTRDEVSYTIRDEGKGFDYSKLPDPTDPANLERCSGRGVLLMRTFMDEVRFNDAGNEVTLVKQREAAEDAILVGDDA